MPAASGAVYRFDSFVLDLGRGVLLESGIERQLRPKSFILLEFLVENAGRVIARDEIMQAVWPDVIVTDDSIAQCIKEIRRTLGDERHQLLRTLPRRGYQFVGPVAISEPAPTAAPSPPPKVAESTLSPSQVSPAEPAPPVQQTEPQRRQVTIASCELIYTSDADLDVEDLRNVIGDFHRSVADIVSRRNGSVDRRVGNSMIVHFGHPAAHEDDAEQAVRAGLEMCEQVKRLAPRAGLAVRCRVGIATGVVIAGDDLASDDAAGGLFGEAPTLAGRLQGQAEPDTVVIDRTTRSLIGGFFDYRSLPPIEAPPGGTPIAAWQVLGASAIDSRFEALRGRSSTSLVGREEELDLLQRRWTQARAGDGRVVLLSGEPGIGKSRIAQSLLGQLEGEPHARLRYFCSPQHANTALYPFLARIERAARFAPRDGPAERFEKLRAVIEPTTRNPAQDLAVLAELLSIAPTEGYPALAASPQQKLDLTFAALLDQFASLAARGPILVVLEDAHWIDPTSLDLLDRTIDRAASLPVLVVITFRPEFQPTWVGQPHVTMLPLSRLGRRDGARIIAGITKGKALPEPVADQILSRTDGVPLFIEELTNSLLESGLLHEAGDQYALDGPLAPLAIPTSLQASLVARLDRLASVKDVAQIAAAIGREFSHEVIAAVSALTPPDLDAALARLTASGLISRRGTPPNATYSFKHALVQDAAYATMLKSRRRQLHSRIAKVLVELFPETAERLPEVVAHHLTEAGLASEAIGHWLKSGRLAYARSANREAVRFFEQALHVLKALPESRSTLEHGFDLRLELRPALGLLLEGRQVLERLREAEAIAERLNDDRRRGQVYAFISMSLSLLGELDEALATGSRALEIAGRLGDLRLRILATSHLVYAHYIRGEYDQVIALATSNLVALPPDLVYENFGLSGPPSVWDRTWLVVTLAELGRFREAAEYEAEATRVAESTQHAYTKCLAHFGGGMLNLLKGDWAGARPPIERWIAVSQKANFLHHPWGAATSAWALAQLGETSEALSRLKEGQQLLEQQAAKRSFVQRVWGYHALGRAALRLGRLDEAQRLGDSGHESAEGCPGFAAHALHLLGEIATHPDRFDAKNGEAHYRGALALAEPRGMRPLIAHCHLGLCRLFRQTGKTVKARKHLNIATTIYRDLDMRSGLEETAKELR